MRATVDVWAFSSESAKPCMSAPYMTAAVIFDLVICRVLTPAFLRDHMRPAHFLASCSRPLMTTVERVFPSPAPVPRSLACSAGLTILVLVALATFVASLWVVAITEDFVTETCKAT